MRFNYTYRIIYGSGQCCDRSRQQLTIEITREQYVRIIEKIIQDFPKELKKSLKNLSSLKELKKELKRNSNF